MPSTYTLNNGIELIGTGEQSGTWGDTTNTNFELLDTALDGQVSVTLAATGSSGSPNTLPINDGASSNGRNRLVIFGDGSDLGGTAYVQLTPNDAEKIIYVRNNLSGSRSILLFQGTYSASNDYEVPAGTTAIVFFNGAGTGAVAANVFNNAHFDALNVVGSVTVGGGVTVTGTVDAGTVEFDNLSGTGAVSVTNILDEDNMASNSATALSTQQSIKAYVDSQVGTVDTLAEVLANGNTTGGTDISVSSGDDITFADSSKAIFGASSDLQIYHDPATGSYISEVGAGSLFIQSNNNGVIIEKNTGENLLFADNTTGSLKLYHNNDLKLATSSTGVDITGQLSLDTRVTIDGGTGNGSIELGGDTGAFIDFKEPLSEDYNARIIYNDASGFILGGSTNIPVKLAYGGFGTANVKLATTATGVDITGTITSDGLTVETSTGVVLTGTGTGAPHTATRGTAAAGASRPVFTFGANSTADVTDGFGPALQFNITDTGVTASELGAIGFIRDGSDTSGKFVIANGSNNLNSGTSQFMATGPSEGTVFNEGGAAAYDFRVESDSNTHMLFVDAGADYINVGGSVRQDNALLQVTGAKSYSSSYVVRNQIIASDTTALSAGVTGGAIGFNGVYNTGGSTTQFGSVEGLKYNGTSGNYQGEVVIRSRRNGGNNEERVSLSSAEVVFNEDSYDTDFRVESDGSSNAIFMNAGNGTTAFGTTTDNYNHASNEGIYLSPGSSSSFTANSAPIRINRNGTGGNDRSNLEFYNNGAIRGWIGSLGAEDGIFLYANGSNGIHLYSDEVVVNENSSNHDFRVESDSNANMLFVDAGGNKVGVGTNTIQATMHVYSGDSGASVNSNANDLFVESSADAGITIGSGNTSSGSLRFADNGGNGRGIVYYDHSNDNLVLYSGGSERVRLSLTNTVFNEDSGDTDFRVESNNNANMLFVDGGNDLVMVGSSTPSSPGQQGLKVGDGWTYNSYYFSFGGSRTLTFSGQYNYQIEVTVMITPNTGNIGQSRFIAGRRDWSGSAHCYATTDIVNNTSDIAVSTSDSGQTRSYTLTFTHGTDSANVEYIIEVKSRNSGTITVS